LHIDCFGALFLAHLKAILDTIGDAKFNEHIKEITLNGAASLINGEKEVTLKHFFPQYDKDDNPRGPGIQDPLPGDWRYFVNPGAKAPMTGENAVELVHTYILPTIEGVQKGGLRTYRYYLGFPLGEKTESKKIDELNKYKGWFKDSAYLSDYRYNRFNFDLLYKWMSD
jgi:hypothetical protein